MNRLWILILALPIACQNPADSTQASGAPTEAGTQEPTSGLPLTGPEGCFVGMFSAEVVDSESDFSAQNKITLCIDSLKNGVAYGRTFVAGNYRPFSGPYTQTSEGYEITGKEPGDDRYDGVFYFTLSQGEQKVKGRWKANNKLQVTERTYELERRQFRYDPALYLPEDVSWSVLYDQASQYVDEGEFLTEAVAKLNPSLNELKVSDVENMYKGDLEVLRNSIYARHGYTFRNRKMRYVFDRVDWYMPYSADIRADLTPLEKKNIDLIQRYEQHAVKYYDSFGR